MQTGFKSPHSWAELNDQATEILGLTPAGGKALLFPGVGAALAELTMGLSRQFPHRRKIFYFKSVDPALEEAAIQMSREGCQIQPLALDVLSRPDELKTILDSNALFVLAADDDPLLGRRFDLKSLEEITEGKKIFLIRVSNGAFRFSARPAAYTRNTFHVHRMAVDVSPVLTSARLNWPIQFANRLQLPENSLDVIRATTSAALSSESAILKLESALIAGAKPIFDSQTPRVFDRAVIFWPDLDGWTVLTRLSERLKIPLDHSLLETTSLHRWKGVKTMDWLYGLGFLPEMIRGTLIIDQSLLTRADFATHLEAVCSEIRKIQLGN